MQKKTRAKTRKRFLVATAALFGLGWVAACGDDGGDSGDDDDGTGATDAAGACEDDPRVVITENHGHAVPVITLEEVEALDDETYMLTGGGHEHTFTVTAGHFEQLQKAGSVNVSTQDSDHIIELSC